MGKLLRTARVERNLTVEDVSDQTKIRPDFLKSLENGRYDELPGHFFVLNFLRQYASAVGAEVEDSIESLGKELEKRGDEDPGMATVIRSQPITYFLGRATSRLGNSVRRNAGMARKLVLSTVLVGGLYLAYNQYGPLTGTGVVSDVASPPTSAAGIQNAGPSGAPELTRPAAGGPIATQTDPAPVSRPPVPRPTPPPTAGSAGAESESGGLATAPPATAGGAPAPASVTEGPVRMEIRATEEVWIRAVSDGTTTREFLLQAGERRQLPPASSVELMIGNAGGIVLLINGREQEPIGLRGQVRRILVTREGMEVARP